MRRIDARWNWAAAAILATSLALSGCTAIGFAVGGMVDSAVKDKSRTLVAHVHRGDHLTLHMRDGNVIQCKMLWLEEPDAAAYAARYEVWRRSVPDSGLIPRPGERVKLSNGKRALEGGFQGLAPAGVRIASSGTAKATLVPFQEFQTLVDERGRPNTSHLLAEHVVMGRVPTGTRVTFTHVKASGGTAGVVNAEGTGAVAWDDVVRVDGPSGRTWKTLGTVLGVFADITILVAAAAVAASGSSGYGL
jgi:hypothetical protein